MSILLRLTSYGVQHAKKFPKLSQTSLKATYHLTIFMREIRAKGKIQRNNHQYGQRGPSFAGKTSSVYLIAYLHVRKIAECSLQQESPLNVTGSCCQRINILLCVSAVQLTCVKLGLHVRFIAFDCIQTRALK